jgi:hypothetical protein
MLHSHGYKYSSTQFWDIVFSSKVSSTVISVLLFSLREECGKNDEIIKAAGEKYKQHTVRRPKKVD